MTHAKSSQYRDLTENEYSASQLWMNSVRADRLDESVGKRSCGEAQASGDCPDLSIAQSSQSVTRFPTSRAESFTNGVRTCTQRQDKSRSDQDRKASCSYHSR